MNARPAEAIQMDNRAPARVVVVGPFRVELAVLDEGVDRIYGVRVSPSDLSDLALDLRAACGAAPRVQAPA